MIHNQSYIANYLLEVFINEYLILKKFEISIINIVFNLVQYLCIPSYSVVSNLEHYCWEMCEAEASSP